MRDVLIHMLLIVFFSMIGLLMSYVVLMILWMVLILPHVVSETFKEIYREFR